MIEVRSAALTATMPLISQMSVLNVPAEQKAEQVGVHISDTPLQQLPMLVLSH